MDGEILVPPLKGQVHSFWRGIVVGEVAFDDNTWLEKYGKAILEHNGVGTGHFQAVISNIGSDKMNVTIPAGKYDDIQATIKGGKFSFYVAKMDDKDTLRWGVVNGKGEEIIPCKYLGIYKENYKLGFLVDNVGGKYVVSNDLTMDEANKLVENKENIAKMRKQEWANILNDLGDALITTAETINQVQQIKSSNNSDMEVLENTTTSKGGSYQQQYENWERRAKANYNSLTNLGLRGESKDGDKGGTTGQGMSSSNYSQMKKALREAQREMKNIRMKAKKNGINITQSKWETAVVKY